MSSSEEEAYDSEEEALRARQAQAARAARVRAQAAQERERLRGYQARQRLEEEQGFRFCKESGQAWAQEGQRCEGGRRPSSQCRALDDEAALIGVIARDGERCVGRGACAPPLQRGVWGAQWDVMQACAGAGHCLTQSRPTTPPPQLQMGPSVPASLAAEPDGA